MEILAPVLAQVTGKALRALAVMGDKRTPTLPAVPTVAEVDPAASKGFSVASWNAFDSNRFNGDSCNRPPDPNDGRCDCVCGG